MKTIVVEDFAYDQFQELKKGMGNYGTRPAPGTPKGHEFIGFDDTAALQRIIASHKLYLQIKTLVIK